MHGHHKFLSDRRNEKSAADAAFKRMRMEKMRLDMALRTGELVPVQEYLDEDAQFHAMIKNDVIALPAVFSRDLAERARMMAHVNALLSKWSRHSVTNYLKNGGDPDPELSESDDEQEATR